MVSIASNECAISRVVTGREEVTVLCEGREGGAAQVEIMRVAVFELG